MELMLFSKNNLVDVDRRRIVIINDFTLTDFNIRLLKFI